MTVPRTSIVATPSTPRTLAVIVAVPSSPATTFPLESIWATRSSLLRHVTGRPFTTWPRAPRTSADRDTVSSGGITASDGCSRTTATSAFCSGPEG